MSIYGNLTLRESIGGNIKKIINRMKEKINN